MTRSGRTALAILLVVGGLAFTFFFVGVVGIADCSDVCLERGEPAVAWALMAAGLGVAAAGALLLRASGTRAASWGLLVAGAANVLAVAWLLARGGGGWTWWSLALSLVPLGLGAYLRSR
ncbi:MAG TPA: hypothetical protein VM582_08890 [Candidatus Thermoplasmatota archaeon]|nr:hypothetical protein [Candidatus Thermoplasmatota archaeon]